MTKDYNQILIENVRRLISSNNMTQAEFGKIIGMHQSAISKALNPDGEKTFTLDQVIKIARHFKISVDKLMGNETFTRSEMSVKDIAVFIANLIEDNDAIVVEHAIRNTDDTQYYHALYFPPKLCEVSKNKGGQTESGRPSYTSTMYYSPIEEFINQFLQINKAFKETTINDEVQKSVKTELLKKLSRVKFVREEDDDAIPF